MLIKITVRYHLTPVRMGIIWDNKIASVSKDMEKNEPWLTAGGNVYWYNHYGKQYGDSPKQ